jgi:hypothetical protein
VKSTNSINAMNETFSGKSITSKIDDMKLSVFPPVAPGANVEPDKKKSMNGKNGLSRTTIKLRRNGIGEYRLKPFLESPLRNKQTLENIIKRLETGTLVKCPKCNVAWNRLTPNGMCYECDPEEQRDRQKFYGS